MDAITIMVTWVTIAYLYIGLSVALPLKQVSNKTSSSRPPVTAHVQQNLATDVQKILSFPTYTRRVRLYNKNGFFLQVSEGRRLRGTRNFNNRNTLLDMESMGTSVVRLKGVVSNSYFCMNGKGIPHVMAHPSDECLFRETLGPNHFHTYTSYKYSGRNSGNMTHEFYIAIKKNGKLKHGANTGPIQKSVDFMVLPLKKGNQ